jgi:hypothetical protein
MALPSNVNVNVKASGDSHDHATSRINAHGLPSMGVDARTFGRLITHLCLGCGGCRSLGALVCPLHPPDRQRSPAAGKPVARPPTRGSSEVMVTEHVPSVFRLVVGKSPNDPFVAEWLASMQASIARIDELFYSKASAHGVSVRYELVGPNRLPEHAMWSDLVVSAVHLHADGHEDYAEYAGQLPMGLRFGDDVDTVLRRAAPDVVGGSMYRSGDGASVPKWVRWRVMSLNVHAQFSGAGQLEMVTVESLSA